MGQRRRESHAKKSRANSTTECYREEKTQEGKLSEYIHTYIYIKKHTSRNRTSGWKGLD